MIPLERGFVLWGDFLWKCEESKAAGKLYLTKQDFYIKIKMHSESEAV